MAFRAFGSFYSRSFEKRPYVTLAIANGFLGVVADSLAQSFEKYNKSNQQKSIPDQIQDKVETVTSKIKSQSSSTSTSIVESTDWDFARSSRFLAFGMGMAPLLCEWNNWIERSFPLRNAGKVGKVSLKALGKRVAVDQGLFAPFGLMMFVGAMGVMEGRNLESLKTKFSEIYAPALIANWQVWPLIQAINFRFMPLRYRVPFTGACGIAWQVFLSLLNATKKDEQTEVRLSNA